MEASGRRRKKKSAAKGSQEQKPSRYIHKNKSYMSFCSLNLEIERDVREESIVLYRNRKEKKEKEKEKENAPVSH